MKQLNEMTILEIQRHFKKMALGEEALKELEENDEEFKAQLDRAREFESAERMRKKWLTN